MQAVDDFLERLVRKRNELVHSKPAPPMDVSIRFLQSYMESLMAVKRNSHGDPAIGKTTIVMDGDTKHTCAVAVEMPTWSRPVDGWVKVNTDGAFV